MVQWCSARNRRFYLFTFFSGLQRPTIISFTPCIKRQQLTFILEILMFGKSWFFCYSNGSWNSLQLISGAWVVVFFFITLLYVCLLKEQLKVIQRICWFDPSQDCCNPGTAGYTFFLSLLPFLASGWGYLAANWLRNSIQPNSLGFGVFFALGWISHVIWVSKVRHLQRSLTWAPVKINPQEKWK